MKKLTLTAVAIVICSGMSAWAQMSPGVYSGVDGKGKACQVTILKAVSVKDPNAEIPPGDDVNFTDIKTTYTMKTSFFPNETVNAEPTMVDGEATYPNFSFWGNFGKDYKSKLNFRTDGDSGPSVDITAPEYAGLLTERDHCGSLSLKQKISLNDATSQQRPLANGSSLH